MEPFLFFGGAIVFFILLFAYSVFQARKRKEAWQVAATKMNFKFIETDASEARFGDFKIFTQGHSRSSYNILVGTNGTDEVRTLDYKYTTGHGKNSHTYYQTLCIIRSNNLNVPHFFIRRESPLYDFLGKLFGGQDINFAEDPAFSRAFVLQGEGEQAIRHLFNARIRKLFLQFEGTDMQVEGRGDTILFNPTALVDPEKVGSLIVKAINVKNTFAPPPE